MARPRVTELLRQASARRVTLVSAPAGAGKTIACQQWAASEPAPGVAWLDLDAGDRRPGQLWSRLRAALTDSADLPGDVLAALPDPGADTFPVDLAKAAEMLPAPVTLVVDDVHEIAGSHVLTEFDHLIRHAPPTLRFVLCGRHPAGLQVARLRVCGELAEISTDDLAATPQEADDFFALLGMDLEPGQRAELLRRTQGWMTGLRLAALRARAGPAEQVSGDDPQVADYLRDEVLSALPEDSRLFLARTSVADAVCGDLADAITGGTGGGAALDHLARQNLMIRPVGAGSAWYRYHPLLLGLLRVKLHDEHPGEMTALARRAAHWQAGHGCAVPAIRNAALAGDWDFAARVLADTAPALLLPDTAAELEPVIASFPASRFVSDASVAGALAAAGVRTGDQSAAALHLDNAQRALHRSPATHRRTIGTWLQALRLMNAGGLACAPDELREQSAAIAVAGESAIAGAAGRQALGLLWSALGVSALASLDIARAREAFDHARRQLHDCQLREFPAQARAWQAVADALAGNLSEARDVLTGQADISDPLSDELAVLASAHLNWAQDDASAARRASDHLGHDQGAPGHAGGRLACTPVLRLLGTLTRARLALSDGDASAAAAVLARLRYQLVTVAAAGGGGDSAMLDVALAPIEIEVALREGDLRRARTVLASAALARAGASRSDRPSLRLARARILAAEGDGRTALAELAPLLTPADDRGSARSVTLADQVGALITAAIAERRLGDMEEATGHLRQALALAEPHLYYRPFLDAGAAARSALTVLISPSSQGAAFAARILQRFDASQSRPAGQGQPEVVRLTSSELAVLRFLPSHMTNQEIAEALFLSINTVKTHLRSVYRKLGVTTRRQAIAYGGKLGLL